MVDMKTLLPRQRVPALRVPMVGGGTWSLDEQSPKNFTLVVFYRGLHCPICSIYLGELNGLVDRLETRGVSHIAVSTDEATRASRAQHEWRLDKLTIGYDLSLEDAREWGLYVSSGLSGRAHQVSEPTCFVEPGLFLVRPDRTLYCSAVQSMPFARPRFDDVLSALDFVLRHDYPARGEMPSVAACR